MGEISQVDGIVTQGMDQLDRDMEHRWNKFISYFGKPDDTDTIFRDIKTRYSEPKRSYHTFQHIQECLIHMDGLPQELVDNITKPQILRLAIWLHDIVYDPQRSDNEEQSAEIAYQVGLQLGLEQTELDMLRRLILVTKSHNCRESIDAQIMTDVDLAILGASEERFQEYEEQIRQEYSWVDESTYYRERAKILQTLVEDPVYCTSYFEEKYRQQAKFNVAELVSKWE